MDGGGETIYFRASHSTGRVTSLVPGTKGYTGSFAPVTLGGLTGALVTRDGNVRAIDWRRVTKGEIQAG